MDFVNILFVHILIDYSRSDTISTQRAQQYVINIAILRKCLNVHSPLHSVLWRMFVFGKCVICRIGTTTTTTKMLEFTYRRLFEKLDDNYASIDGFSGMIPKGSLQPMLIVRLPKKKEKKNRIEI